MVDVHPNIKYGGYATGDDSSPKSMRRADALLADPLPYVARMVTTNASGVITILREDDTEDDVYCVAGHNPYRFIQLVEDTGSIVEDVHF